MTLQEKVEGDFLTAFKNKEEAKVSVLRMLKTSLINKKIEKRMAKEEFLPDDEVMAVIKTEVKKRQDSVITYHQGNRNDLADKEEAEIKVLSQYLPESLPAEQVRELVKEAIAEIGASAPSDFGKVMGLVMKKAKGQAEGDLVSTLVKEILNS